LGERRRGRVKGLGRVNAQRLTTAASSWLLHPEKATAPAAALADIARFLQLDLKLA